MLASGILGISLDVFNRLHRSGAGAVVTKSLSIEPWEGYPNPTIFSVNGGGWMNAVGLSNPGASNFAKMIEHNQDVPIIVRHKHVFKASFNVIRSTIILA